MRIESLRNKVRYPRTIGLALAAFLTIGLATGCSDDSGSPAEPDVEPVEAYDLITTVMGTGVNGQGVDGDALTVHLSLPQNVNFGPDGKMYVLDWNNHRVRVVENGVSSTLIGTGELGDALEGPASEIKLNHPTQVAFDPTDGNLVLSAWHNSKILKMDLDTGMMTLIVGNGGRDFGGDGGPAVDAILDLPSCAIFDKAGNMWISDLANQCVRMVDTNGIINTVVGGSHIPGYSGDGGPAIDAQIFLPVGQAAPPVGKACFDDEGNYYLADTVNNVIRKVDTNGIITTVAGSGRRGFDGDGGLATEARMAWPSDVAVGPHGNLFIADTRNNVIRKVDQESGIITTFAGTPNTAGFAGDGGHPAEAMLDRPYGLEFDAEGNLFIADTHNHRIRVVWRYQQ